MSGELLTIAIPFYKGQAFLRKAIESVFRQSSPDWRLIVCDDGPETETEKLVASFHDQRIRYLKNEHNLGMAGNWNRCLDSADTDLVNLLHNDDELLSNYVEVMRRAAGNYPQAAAFFCTARIIDETGRERFSIVDYAKRFLRPRTRTPHIFSGAAALEALMRGNFIMCPTVCYRKSRLGGERFSGDWRFVLDLEFYMRLLFAGETLIGLPDIAYAYRRHGESATEAYTQSLLRFEEESLLHDQVAALARQRGLRTLARVAAQKKIIKSHLLFRIGRDLGRLEFDPAVRKWKFLRAMSGQALGMKCPQGVGSRDSARQ
jgi:glycosyltransferase involved in cell wall biosynthesis